MITDTSSQQSFDAGDAEHLLANQRIATILHLYKEGFCQHHDSRNQAAFIQLIHLLFESMQLPPMWLHS